MIASTQVAEKMNNLLCMTAVIFLASCSSEPNNRRNEISAQSFNEQNQEIGEEQMHKEAGNQIMSFGKVSVSWDANGESIDSYNLYAGIENDLDLIYTHVIAEDTFYDSTKPSFTINLDDYLAIDEFEKSQKICFSIEAVQGDKKSQQSEQNCQSI